MTDRTAFVQFRRIGEVMVAVAADERSAALFEKAKPDTTYRIIPKRSRDATSHRKVMALIQDCFNNQEDYEHFEPFREAMKIECGWVEFTTTTVRDIGEAERYIGHLYTCKHHQGSPCDCGRQQVLDDLRTATHIKTKSQSFDECSEEEAAELWERVKEWAVKYLGHEAVNSYEGGW